jgi:hypothetical protein
LLPLHLLWAAAKVHPHLSHLQSHLEDDWLLVAAAAVDVAVVHDVAAIIAAAFAGAVLLVAADADAAADAAAVAAVSVAVPELSVVVSKHHLTYNLLQWLK